MSIVSRFLERFRPPPPARLPRLFERQIVLETEGAAACSEGYSSTANPYSSGTMEWNHWLYGWSLAENEKHIIAQGGYHLCSTAEHGPVAWVSLEAREKSGNPWKPRYYIERH